MAPAGLAVSVKGIVSGVGWWCTGIAGPHTDPSTTTEH